MFYRIISIVFLFIMITSCRTYTGVIFLSNDPEYFEENGILFSYVCNGPRPNTTIFYDNNFYIYVESDIYEQEIIFSNYKIEIEEFNIIFEKELNEKMLCKYKKINNRENYKKQYSGHTRVTIDDYMSNIIKSEKDLIKFRKVKKIIVTASFDYKINDKEEKTIIRKEYYPKIEIVPAFLYNIHV
ncbi:hypothetical protein AGMMS50268_39910 [Spirochaetia bacterium]|nr:hypothetical protein AGMMS50268_39910 [Spirochaetia bacterium]